ncbi:peptidase M24, structural domain-containing protein [Lactarius deliciosus]|nr:peptidase M24, structural domain-containing protein [Lactarius deliciosus]
MAAVITDNVILSVGPEQVSQDVLARLGQELGADHQCVYNVRLLNTNGFIAISRWIESFDRRQDSHAVAKAIGLSYVNTARSPVEGLKANGQLEKFRSELPLFEGLSLTTISSTGSNGVIIHYSPDPNDCAIIQKDRVYLCDSGGQYLDGTTDVTRTLHFGTPTDEQRRAFTRVLQGHIAIDAVIFPSGTSDV